MSRLKKYETKKNQVVINHAPPGPGTPLPNELPQGINLADPVQIAALSGLDLKTGEITLPVEHKTSEVEAVYVEKDIDPNINIVSIRDNNGQTLFKYNAQTVEIEILQPAKNLGAGKKTPAMIYYVSLRALMESAKRNAFVDRPLRSFKARGVEISEKDNPTLDSSKTS